MEINGDSGHPEIVIIPEYEAQLWYLTLTGDGMYPSDWTSTLMDMPGPESGKKIDNAHLVDLDLDLNGNGNVDGDTDISTTEENGGWGVVWFENPATDERVRVGLRCYSASVALAGAVNGAPVAP